MGPFDQVFQFCYFTLAWLQLSASQQPLLILTALVLTAVAILLIRLFSSSQHRSSNSELDCHPPTGGFFLPALFALLVICLVPALLLHQQSLRSQLERSKAALQEIESAVQEGREQRDQLLKSLPKEEVGKNPLDGCLHVFVDLGSNRGLQIRKLYESHLFPLAPILPLYEKYFGAPETRNLQELCTVAFEPNPQHTEHLQSLAANYSTCGIRVVAFTETGVSEKDAVGNFAADLTFMEMDIVHGMTARFLPTEQTLDNLKETHALGGSEVMPIKMMRLAKFITDVVAKRKLPLSARVTKPRVVVKCDIEGGELGVVTDMVVTGAMEVVDNLHMEWHGVQGPGFIRTGDEAEMIDKLAEAVTTLSKVTMELGMEGKVLVEEQDDETYSGLAVYQLFGDYSLLPSQVC